jgi:hypothetical protein
MDRRRKKLPCSFTSITENNCDPLPLKMWTASNRSEEHLKELNKLPLGKQRSEEGNASFILNLI